VLLKQPKLICLDATNLDAATDVLFQSVLATDFSAATIVYIAHRIDTLKWCRTRIEMEGGKILRVSDISA